MVNQQYNLKEVKSFANQAGFPATGTADVIYIDKATNTPYYWTGTAYAPLSSPAGDTVSVYIQSSSTTKPSPAIEGDELIITSNGQATGGVVTEQWIFDGTNWIQLPNDKVLDVLTTAQTPPTIGSINTTNLGKIFKGTDGNSYIVDYSGEAIQLSSPDVVTDITSITNGFRYTNESNQNDDITFEVNNTDPQNVKVEVKLNGTKVAEFPLYTVNNDIQINNTGSEWDLTDDKITILETNGDSQTITFPYRVTVVANPNGTIDIKQNGVIIGTIPAPATDIKYSKALFVDAINGSDTSGTGSDNNMFKTIAKALTVADGSGFRIVLAPGVYAENPTISLPNLDIVTLAGSDRGNTSIQGTVTFSHTSSSSGIQGIAMTDLRHSGAGALYVTDCQVNGGLVKNSTGYIEITDTQLQGTTTTSLNAGTGLIKDSLIKNMLIQGASSGYTLKSNIIDADGTVTFSGGAFYNIQDNSGNIVTTAGVNMETGLIASGLSSALAKQYVTDFSNKLGMLNPDSNATPTKFVTWNEATRRLEISDKPSGLPSGGTDGQVLTVQPDGSYAWENLPASTAPLHQREVLTATGGQTAFTLSATPIGGTEKVHVSRNGIDISDAFTWVNGVGTYDPANNYGCVIDANDELIFHYEKENGSSSSGVAKSVVKARWSAITNLAANTSIPVANLTQTQINTTPSQWNATTGVYTANADGVYMVSANVSATATLLNGSYISIDVRKNGTTENVFVEQSTGGGTVYITAGGTVPMLLVAGDTISFTIFASVASQTHIQGTNFSITQL
jgi:hypothetical protein